MQKLIARLPVAALLASAFLGLSTLPAFGQTGQNVEKTIVLTAPGKYTEAQLIAATGAEKRVSYQYLDGLGRPIQQVEAQASPGANATTLGYDLVLPIVYDQYGRQPKAYLPYVAPTQTGAYQGNFLTYQAAFYANSTNNNADKIVNDAYPFALTVFEASPLGRATEQGAPGLAWQPGTQPAQGHTQRNQFRVNLATDNVRVWNATTGPTATYYAEGDLAVSRNTDENENQVLAFADKLGRTVLKRVQIDETVEGVALSWLETYYVYDDWGNVKYQVPPKAVVKLNAGTSWNQAFTDEWVFSYVYDARNRLVEKKAPGALVTYLCYDPLDRPVLVQDGNLRALNKWRFVKYDLKQRPLIQGLYLDNTNLTRPAMQAYLNGLNYATIYYEEKQAATAHGYSNQCFPTTGTEIQLVSYYDDYDFNADAISDYGYTSQGLPGEGGKGEGQKRYYQGLLTGTKTLVLGTATWITQFIFYDRYGNLVQTRRNSHLLATYDNVTTQVYNYDKTLRYRKQVKKISATVQNTVLDRFVYDLRSRPVAYYQTLDAGTEKQVAAYEYNALGQLVDKQLYSPAGANPVLQSVDYRYHIRGWLASVNNSTLTADNGVTNDETNDVFGMAFLYEQADATSLGNTLRYNGQLSAVKWKVNDVNNANNVKRERSYKFTYDKVDRLKQALFQGWGTTAWNAEVGGYDEKGPDVNGIRYDANGNLLALRRYTLNNGTTTPVLLDDLAYAYTAGLGNQLQKVEDASGNPAGFKNGQNLASEYTYDANGNLSTDANKVYLTGTGTTLSYNELGKTTQVDIGGGNKVQYVYDGAGTRLRKLLFSTAGGATPVKTLDYLEGFVYENGVLAYFSMGEGRVRNAGGTLQYEFFLKDQLGNVRVSLEDNGSGVARVTQENHYYPFGLTMQGIVNNTPIPSVANKQLYNAGSELQDDWGFEHSYSTFYREYDPALGRFNALDPMTDQLSSWTPYNFAFNDPANLNDPLGDMPAYTRDKVSGKRQYENDGWGGGRGVSYGGDEYGQGGGGDNYGGYGSMSSALAAASKGRAAEGVYSSDRSYYRLNEGEWTHHYTDWYTNGEYDRTDYNGSTFTPFAQQGQDPLKDSHGHPVYTLEEFSARYRGCTYDEISHESKVRNGLPGGPKLRMVQNPRDGNIMDMRHVAVVGYKYGRTMGYIFELTQLIRGMGQAFNGQDMYSNAIGEDFSWWQERNKTNPTDWSKEFYNYMNRPNGSWVPVGTNDGIYFVH